MIEFVTSMSFSYFEKYGKRMINTFLKFVEVNKLSVYHEDYHYKFPEFPSPRIKFVGLWEVNGFPAYMQDAEKHVSEKIGKVSLDPDSRVGQGNYDYRWDALTFGKKAFSFFHAARKSKADLIFWVDADIIFYRHLPAKILKALFTDKSGKECSVVHFGRRTPHSETGFFGVDLTTEEGQWFIEIYSSYWEKRNVFKLEEGWTDSHVFDKALAASHASAANLSTLPEGHVIAASPLSYYLDHLKGAKRKKLGVSPERKV